MQKNLTSDHKNRNQMAAQDTNIVLDLAWRYFPISDNKNTTITWLINEYANKNKMVLRFSQIRI